jgi:hypothetical protein
MPAKALATAASSAEVSMRAKALVTESSALGDISPRVREAADAEGVWRSLLTVHKDSGKQDLPWT